MNRRSDDECVLVAAETPFEGTNPNKNKGKCSELALAPGELTDAPPPLAPAQRRLSHPWVLRQGGRLCAERKANKGELQPDVGAFRFTDGSWGTRSQSSSRTFLLSTRKPGDVEAQGIPSALGPQVGLLCRQRCCVCSFSRTHKGMQMPLTCQQLFLNLKLLWRWLRLRASGYVCAFISDTGLERCGISLFF